MEYSVKLFIFIVLVNRSHCLLSFFFFLPCFPVELFRMNFVGRGSLCDLTQQVGRPFSIFLFLPLKNTLTEDSALSSLFLS